MALISIRDIVNEALAVVGEVSGTGTQTYSEDRMMKDAIRGFNMIFKKFYWPQYTDWFTIAVDGTTGVPTTDWATNVRDIEDIMGVFKAGSDHAIPMLPTRLNPNVLSSGSAIQYWKPLLASHTSYANRRIRVYPFSATEGLDVQAKVYPVANNEDMDFDDEIDLDKDMLVAGTAFMTLSGDDLNPGAADAQRNMMEQRYKDIMGSFASQPIRVTGHGSNIPNAWSVSR